MTGIARLTFCDYGDGHSGIDINLYKHFFVTQKQRDDYMDFLDNKKSRKLTNLYAMESNLYTAILESGKVINSEETDSSIPTEFEVISGGKTAVIRFDHFWHDYLGWKAYYNQKDLTANQNPDPTKEELNEGKVAVPNDTKGLFYRSFYTLMNNPDYADVENIIIDLSLNGGGIVEDCYDTLCYLIESVQNYRYDVRTNTFSTIFTTSDLNLDGLIDGADKDFQKYISENYNIAVLTSTVTASAANIFACCCYEAGIPIIGERSCGLSCIRLSACTLEGACYYYSYRIRNSFKDGSTQEIGAPVTKELSYDKFYNDTALQTVMDELFAKE